MFHEISPPFFMEKKMEDTVLNTKSETRIKKIILPVLALRGGVIVVALTVTTSNLVLDSDLLMIYRIANLTYIWNL